MLHGCVFSSEGDAVGPCKALENELLHEFEEEIGTGRSLIEDAITTVVSAKTYDELSAPEGREELRAENLALDRRAHPRAGGHARAVPGVPDAVSGSPTTPAAGTRRLS